MSNLDLWNSVEKTDVKFTKEVNFGFKYTSINPQWQTKRATEVWGPLGIGWWYSYVTHRDDYSNGETIFSVDLSLQYIYEGQTSHPVCHTGVCQSGVLKSDGKLRTDTEARKKATTNALSKTLSMIGFSGDIYMGYFDNPDYKQVASDHFAAEKESQKRDVMLHRLENALTQTGAGPASEEEELLCRYWSDGAFGSVDAHDDEVALREILSGQVAITSGKGRDKVPIVNQLEAARHFVQKETND